MLKSRYRRLVLESISVVAVALVIQSCRDLGSAIAPPPDTAPVLVAIAPDSAAVGDTIRVTGSNFGNIQLTSVISIGGKPAKTIAVWTDTEIRAEVPLLASTDSVRVSVSNKSSNAVPFKASLVRYSQSVNPVFQSTCAGCHGGEHSLFLETWGALMSGTSATGPVVVAGNGEGSLIVRMLRGTAPGRPSMPLGSPLLPESKINKISTWIQQGALNN